MENIINTDLRDFNLQYQNNGLPAVILPNE